MSEKHFNPVKTLASVAVGAGLIFGAKEVINITNPDKEIYQPQIGHILTITNPIFVEKDLNTHEQHCTLPRGTKVTIFDAPEKVITDLEYKSSETLQVKVDLNSISPDLNCPEYAYPRSLKRLTANAEKTGFDAVIAKARQEVINSRSNNK